MRLSKENIKFINNYLENSDVRHLDIRLEMVDHIATAIEEEIEQGDQRPFIKIFKDYMLKNKRTLIENKHRYLKSVMIKNLKLIFKLCVSIKGLCFSVIIFALLYISIMNYGIQAIRTIIYYLSLGLIILPILSYYIAVYVLKLQKISAVERLGMINLVFFQVIHFLRLVSSNNTEWTASPLIISFFITLIFTFGIAFTVVAFQIVRKGVTQHKKMQLL